MDKMIPQDKFNNPIYPSKFRILQKQGELLMKIGYKESMNKPNLLYKSTPEGVFFADMRGTKEVPIWKDTSPLFYWKFKTKIPMWKRRRLINEELKNLDTKKIPVRFSYEITDGAIEFEKTSAFISGSFIVWDDGYCKFCKKDFHDEGSYCSKECEQSARKKWKIASKKRL
jgi:hypothetical protein